MCLAKAKNLMSWFKDFDALVLVQAKKLNASYKSSVQPFRGFIHAFLTVQKVKHYFEAR